jgi:hypothetical protein
MVRQGRLFAIECNPENRPAGRGLCASREFEAFIEALIRKDSEKQEEYGEADKV